MAQRTVTCGGDKASHGGVQVDSNEQQLVTFHKYLFILNIKNKTPSFTARYWRGH